MAGRHWNDVRDYALILCDFSGIVRINGSIYGGIGAMPHNMGVFFFRGKSMYACNGSIFTNLDSLHRAIGSM